MITTLTNSNWREQTYVMINVNGGRTDKQTVCRCRWHRDVTYFGMHRSVLAMIIDTRGPKSHVILLNCMSVVNYQSLKDTLWTL